MPLKPFRINAGIDIILICIDILPSLEASPVSAHSTDSILNHTGLPFLFVTGYDQAVIPDEFESFTRLQKPVEFRQIVSELAIALS